MSNSSATKDSLIKAYEIAHQAIIAEINWLWESTRNFIMVVSMLFTAYLYLVITYSTYTILLVAIPLIIILIDRYWFRPYIERGYTRFLEQVVLIMKVRKNLGLVPYLPSRFKKAKN